jgi:hypothetical protein
MSARLGGNMKKVYLLIAALTALVLSAPISPKRKRLLCRYNLHHKWVRRFNKDGEDYLQCRACGKDLYDVERVDPSISGASAVGRGFRF